MNILVTGFPGSGKTTLAAKLAERLAAMRPAGFITEEIREGGLRLGFALRSFDGRTGILAHVDIRGPHRVGKYGVDVEGFERFLDGISFFAPESRLIVIDEIGKMECLSPRFMDLAGKVLESATPLVATVALKGAGFIADVKARSDVRLYRIDEKNRDRLGDDLAELMEPQ